MVTLKTPLFIDLFTCQKSTKINNVRQCFGKLFSLQTCIKKVLHQTDTTLFRIVSDIVF